MKSFLYCGLWMAMAVAPLESRAVVLGQNQPSRLAGKGGIASNEGGGTDQIRKSTVRFVTIAGVEIGKGCSGYVKNCGEIVSAAHCFEDEKLQAALKIGVLYAEVYNSVTKQRERHLVKFARFRNNSTGNRKSSDPKADYEARLASMKWGDFFDLSVAHLESPAANCVPAPTARKEECDNKKDYKILGTGQTETGKLSDVARTASYRYVGWEQSHLRLNSPSTDGGRVCHGDSGGPVFCLKKDGKPGVVGILSDFEAVPTGKNPLGTIEAKRGPLPLNVKQCASQRAVHVTTVGEGGALSGFSKCVAITGENDCAPRAPAGKNLPAEPASQEFQQ